MHYCQIQAKHFFLNPCPPGKLEYSSHWMCCLEIIEGENRQDSYKACFPIRFTTGHFHCYKKQNQLYARSDRADQFCFRIWNLNSTYYRTVTLLFCTHLLVEKRHNTAGLFSLYRTENNDSKLQHKHKPLPIINRKEVN